MNLYLDLFLTFAKVGVCTFGGGYAMLPILQREVVEKKGWVTEEEVTDYFAIGQCTPGIIAVNTSVFIGYRQRGVPGGIAAALGVVFPSFVVITIIAAFLTKFATYPVVPHALHLFGSSGAGRAVRAAGCGPGHPAGSGAGSPLQSCIPCGGSRSDRLAAGPGEAPIPRR